MSFTITGSTGHAGSTVNYSGAASGSTTADGSGNYTISGLANGVYVVAPSFLGLVSSPIHQIVTVNGGNVTGVNFTATAVYSEVDSRITANAEKDVQGTDEYSVQTPTSAIPTDSRATGQPVDSRAVANIPVNSRNTPH
jgi:hypothetical protein